MKRLIININILFLFIISGCGLEITEQDILQESSQIQETNVEHFPSTEWKTITPGEAGIDPSVLESIDNFISTEENFHSFLLTRKGYLIFEKYYSGYSKDKLNNVKSVTKSITSLLTGIAIDKGMIEGTNEKLSQLFPHYFDENTDPEKADITLKDLLTMSAGLEWNNEGGTVKDTWWELRNEPNKYALNAPDLVEKPGVQFNYNSSLSHMLAEAIHLRSGKIVLDFARENLFEPLNITNIMWDTDKTGLHRGHSELYMTPRDMMKIGLLVLAGGKWNGNQIVSKEWILESISPKIKALEINGEYGGYAYQWWTRKFQDGYIYFAAGFGGQLIIIIPEYDLVVVTTSAWTSKRNSLKGLKIVEDHIIKN